jgi:flagellar motility protein MotE (MotC chaperone)
VLALVSLWGEVLDVALHWRGMERRIEEERARIEAEYRRVLENSVEFERRIRERWRQKCRAKNERIAALEARVAELERRIEKNGRQGV